VTLERRYSDLGVEAAVGSKFVFGTVIFPPYAALTVKPLVGVAK